MTELVAALTVASPGQTAAAMLAAAGPSPGGATDWVESAGFAARARGPAATVSAARQEIDGASVLVAACGEAWPLEADDGQAPAPAAAAAVVMAAYRRHRTGCFAALDGAFAAVVWDARAQTCLAGHDPLGVIRLLYVRLGDDILIATVARAFTAHPLFKSRLNVRAASQLAVLGYVLDRASLFEGVSVVGPGEHVAVAGSHIHKAHDWSVIRALGPDLHGDGYIGCMAEAALSAGHRASRGGRVLLPLTGGLDSRLLLASVAPCADVTCLTYGRPRDDDVRLARRLARAAAREHIALPLRPDYVARFGGETLAVGEGLVGPVANLTGSLMRDVGPWPWFLSGIGGGLGRLPLRGRALVADTRLLMSDEAEFERAFLGCVDSPVLPWSALRDPDGIRGSVRAQVAHAISPTRGLRPADRLDVYAATQRTPGLSFGGLEVAGDRVGVRAPLLTRAWVSAVLAGDSSERWDDLCRLRLLCALAPELARVPWALTRLPLPASEHVVRLLRRRPWEPGAGGGQAAGTGAGGSGFRRRLAGGLAGRAKAAVYSRGDKRAEWLRTESARWVRSILYDPRVGERGFFDPAGVDDLWRRHLRGHDGSAAIDVVLTIELWCRRFLDGEEP